MTPGPSKAVTAGGKYTANTLDEYVPGSKGKVLKNLLGISSVKAMQQAEFAAFIAAEKGKGVQSLCRCCAVQSALSGNLRPMEGIVLTTVAFPKNIVRRAVIPASAAS